MCKWLRGWMEEAVGSCHSHIVLLRGAVWSILLCSVLLCSDLIWFDMGWIDLPFFSICDSDEYTNRPVEPVDGRQLNTRNTLF
jgi:hypothetical protein